ncbi:MAG TPA: hypothetical protein PKL24_23360 [Polyangiaceae bacterium]|jgi:hypothetical protein|nr:hypothetical protein [Polyangiaceae bacterium]HOD22102.1 hypothetical protein [Polyangiaceae bacterium]HOE50640.1 hypothetical protein [Polyangiaceae bacterium]HOH02036.1 hypothetical protein [Polyangiaceae bacterium]HOR36157.1 hypothetical protein [Polyangiaceae bacterium]
MNSRRTKPSVLHLMGEMNGRSKTCGSAMIAVFLLWQVIAVLHLAFAIHTVCPEHHVVAHADRETGEVEHHPDVPFSDDDECFVLVALAAHGGMPCLDAPQVPVAPSYLLETEPQIIRSIILAQRYRFRLSPSHSPPAAGG